MSKQNLKINDVLILAQKIQNLELGEKQIRVKDDKANNVKSNIDSKVQYINFSPIEVEVLKQHKKIFSNGTKIGKFLSIENITDENSFNFTANTEQQKLKNIIKLSSILAEANSSIDDELIDKLFTLSNWNKPEMTLTQAIRLMRTHLDGNATEPLTKFFKDIKFPKEITDAKNWYNLILKNKKAGSILLPTLKEAPENYDRGLEKLAEILFPRFKEIEKLDNKLSNNVTKRKLIDFTKKIIESNALGDEEKKQITLDDYNQAFGILTDPQLKSSDNLPDLIIDGADIGSEFARYYLAKLPAGDPRGLILGKLTNCCQSISDISAGVAIHGTTQPNSGFYVIFEKTGNQINIAEDRIIAQSFAWLGENNNELVLDSWERLGEDNNKLMDPFFTKFANKLNQDYAIKKVFIGLGYNLPIHHPYIQVSEHNNIKFNGEHPYANDSKTQFIVLHPNSLYNHLTELNRLILSRETDDTIKKFIIQNLNSDVISFFNYFINEAIPNSIFKNAILGNKLEILKLLMENNSELLDNINDFDIKCIFKSISNSNLSYDVMRILLNANKEKIIKLIEISIFANNTIALEALIEKDFDLNTKIYKKYSILSYTVQFGNIDTLSYLLTKDFKLEAIIHAIDEKPVLIKNPIAVFDLLIKKLCNTTNDQTIIQKTLDYKLAKIVKSNNVEFFKYLIEKGADINTLKLPLIDSINASMMEILLQNANIANDINYINESGISAIHSSITKCNVKCFKILLDHNANINLLNNEGQTPLVSAIVQFGFINEKTLKKIINTLVEKKADPHIRDNQGKTALDYCDDELQIQLKDYIKKFNEEHCIENSNSEDTIGNFDCSESQEVDEQNFIVTDFNFQDYSTNAPLGCVVENND